MYSENELSQLKAQLKRREIALLVPSVLLLAAVIAAAILRAELPAELLTVLLGALLIAGWDLYLKPLYQYVRHVDAMLHGITHQVEGDFTRMEEGTEQVEGITCRTLHMVCLDDRNKPYDRIFHYDAEKPVPVWPEGARLLVTYHARMVADVKAL